MTLMMTSRSAARGLLAFASALALGCEAVDTSGAPYPEEIDVASEPLNGVTTFIDTSCDGRRNAVAAAVEVAYANLITWDMLDCMKNAFTTYDYAFPEQIIARMREDMPTKVRCVDLPDGVLAQATVRVADELLEIDFDHIDDARADVAATILHEVAHNKGFMHQVDANSLAGLSYADTFEYAHVISEQIERCSQSISDGQSPARPRGRRRDVLIGETTLAPVGGMGGSPFEKRCGIALGLETRTGGSVDAIGLSCFGLFGGGSTGMAGGGGGSVNNMTCNSSEVLVGVQGFAGGRLNAVGAICQSINSVVAGTRSPADVRRVGWGGSWLDQGFERWCPLGHAVSAIRGRSGSLVDRLEVECAAISGLTQPNETLLSWAGGSGGSLKHDKCAGRSALVGLTYQNETRIFRLGGMCEEVSKSCDGGACSESIGTSRHFLQAHGGTGGFVGQQQCAAGSALVGLNLRTGSLVDSVGGICADVAAWAGTGAAPTTNLGRVGGAGGTATTRTCPRGSFLSGWHLRTGSAVDAIRPICRDF